MRSINPNAEGIAGLLANAKTAGVQLSPFQTLKEDTSPHSLNICYCLASKAEIKSLVPTTHGWLCIWLSGTEPEKCADLCAQLCTRSLHAHMVWF